MTMRTVIVAVTATVLLVAWYAFRPERLFIDQRVNEATGGAGAVVASGAFHGVSHDGKGMATVVRRPDGSRVLELTGFETSNGPDLQLYLVAARDSNDAASVKSAGFVALGALKGNVGDQVYPLPSDLDLERYRAVTVWCRRFGVNFATAPLLVQAATAAR